MIRRSAEDQVYQGIMLVNRMSIIKASATILCMICLYLGIYIFSFKDTSYSKG